ncbi:ribonuclease HI family protein [Candidatus Dependentiae bacterium]|nr:ribonuclease HI family protein [Candidatus Dependentiae bacterium]
MENTHTNTISIFVDGAARNNPGPAGAGVYITYKDEIICKAGFYLGNKTNNQAEYLALLLAFFIANKQLSQKNIKKPHLIISSDSELMVKQMTGVYRVKNQALAKIKNLIDLLLQNQSYTFKHVFRENNVIADALANQGIDKKNALPLDFVTLLADHAVDL